MKKFVDNLPRYWKTVVVVLGVVTALAPDVIQGVQELFADGQWSVQDTFRLLVLTATAFGVYQVRNTTPKGEAPDPGISEAEQGDAAW